MSRKPKVTLETINDNVQLALGKIAGLETTVHNMSLMVAHIPGIEDRLTAIEAEIVLLRSRVDNLVGLYEKLDKRIENLEHEYLAITVALKRLEQRFDRLEAERLSERVQLLEQKVAALEKGPLN